MRGRTKQRRSSRSTLQEMLYAIAFRSQPGLREFEASVLDHIVLRSLGDLDTKDGPISLKSISKWSAFNGNLRLPHHSVVKALDRLRRRGDVKVSGDLRHPRRVTATLTQQGRELLEAEDRQARELLSRVFDRLLPDLPGNRNHWEEALLLCLSSVFSQLGREYAAVLAARKEPTEVVTDSYLKALAGKVARDVQGIAAEDLLYVLRRFFQERTPDFERLIWHLAQMHFAIRELRMGFAASSVKPRLLADRTFYLDTNVLFQVAIDGMPRSGSMRVFVNACQSAGASVAIGQPTLEEFSASLQRQVEQARAVLPKIPIALAEELSDPVYYAYEAANEEGAVPLEDVLRRFENPRRVVKKVDGVRIQDDPWFDSVEGSRDLEDAIEEIRRVTRELKGIPKPWRLARHDAKMILFVSKECSEGRRSTFVTLDSALPRCNIASGGESPLVAPLDALLQWVCPSLSGITDDETLAQVFSAALTARLFPWEEHLHIEHFAILDDLGLDCFELPEDDLRDSVRHLEKVLPYVDPTTDAGKLKLMGEIQKHLATPGKRYQRQLSAEREKREAAEEQLKNVRSYGRENTILRILVSLLIFAVSTFVANSVAAGETFWERLQSFYSVIAVLGAAPWIAPVRALIRRKVSRHQHETF